MHFVKKVQVNAQKVQDFGVFVIVCLYRLI